MIIKLACEGDCGNVWEGEEIDHRQSTPLRVIEAICEDCHRRLYPGSADTQGFVGFLDGWLVTVSAADVSRDAR